VEVEATTPVKRRIEEGLLTPPDTVKSESIIEETKIELEETIGINARISRSTKRRKFVADNVDPFA
jgi:hypothetical protein